MPNVTYNLEVRYDWEWMDIPQLQLGCQPCNRGTPPCYSQRRRIPWTTDQGIRVNHWAVSINSCNKLLQGLFPVTMERSKALNVEDVEKKRKLRP